MYNEIITGNQRYRRYERGGFTMGKYKLMLVDDEPWALVGLQEIIDWEANGFTIVACCSCGTEALEQAGQLRPDAVVTDIRMPDLTGLQLIERLRNWQPQIECIVVSAYSDFELAREAIRLAAVYYVLKPLSAEEVEEAARLMRQNLDRQDHGIGQDGQQENTILQIDIANPVLPSIDGKGRSCYLLLADSLSKLPAQETKKGYWLLLQVEEYFGILTDRLPADLPDGCGVSIAFPDTSEAALMLQTATASLEGGFRFAQSEDYGKSQVSVADIQFYLYTHLDENISLGQLAKYFYITETYLCDIFKKQTGETIVSFLRRLRIYRSKKLLVASTLSLSEIAARCGYKDYSYFGKHFKADVGMSPDLYRKRGRQLL